jgi:hypothetical protein
VTPTASLPMYNLPEMRAVNARFWEALRGLLLEAGLRDLPEGLSYERPPVPDRIGPEVLFSQTCGYPLETIFAGQAVRLGTPCYAVPGCDGPTHCGLFIVPAASTAEELRDLQGGMFLFNHRHSNSGMNLPRRGLADIADGRPLFASVVETGSQPGNLDRLARGEADATAGSELIFRRVFEFRLAEIGSDTSKTSGPIALDLTSTYGQFAHIHLSHKGRLN